MLEQLSKKLQNALSSLFSVGRLSPKHVEKALREVKLALLEADVNYLVVKDFLKLVSERAVGEEVLKSLTPAQQVVKIVYDELVKVLGGKRKKLILNKSPSVIMVVGLQGTGKTTACAKLSLFLRKEGRKPLMVAADLRRPAAILQLETLGEELSLPVYSKKGESAVNVARHSISYAQKEGFNSVIIDTAGRLHLDEEMMQEVSEVKNAAHPEHVLLVVDSMMGQDAVKMAQGFEQKIGVDGVILTKLDGDARGGAALSITKVLGKPIYFVSEGEKPNQFSPFYPDRLASRILGMGDILSLAERAQEVMEEEKARKLEEKLWRAEFTLEDFLEQMEAMEKMGPIKEMLKMLPGGLGKIDIPLDEKKIKRMKAIIQSMTVEERQNPAIIDGSRKRRIARGSGTSPREVNELLKSFFEVKKLMKKAKKRGKKGLKQLFPF